MNRVIFFRLVLPGTVVVVVLLALLVWAERRSRPTPPTTPKPNE